MEKIELTLKNAKLKSYYRISLILAFFNFLVLFAFTFTSTYQRHRVTVMILFLVMLLFLFIKKRNRLNFIGEKETIGLVYIFIVAIWISWQLYWLAALNAIFYILYIFSVRRFDVIVLRNEIIFPSFPKKKIQWNELQNIIMKDGLLTIDFKNNKIVQNEVENDDYSKEKEFNEFCREQLKK